MSDDTARLMARIASMETELATLRKTPKEPKDSFDPQAFRQAFIADPVGTMTKMGAPVDYVTKVLVANALGDQAPQELKVLAAMGPQMSAAQATNTHVEELSRRLKTFEDRDAKAALRTSVHALITDKTKYPHLAKAHAVDPELIESDLATGGTAEEIATALEGKLSKVASIYAPAASAGNAEATTEDSQVKPAAVAGNLSGEVPPIPQNRQGVFTTEDHVKLRDEIVRKYASQ